MDNSETGELSSRHTHIPLQLLGCGGGSGGGWISAAILPPAFGPLLVGSSAGSAGMGWTYATHSSLQCTLSWPTCVRGKARTVHAAYSNGGREHMHTGSDMPTSHSPPCWLILKNRPVQLCGLDCSKTL